jgi:hypothetical protein
MDRRLPDSGEFKTRAWFNHANKTSSEPFNILGTVIGEFMEKDNDEWDPPLREGRFLSRTRRNKN